MNKQENNQKEFAKQVGGNSDVYTAGDGNKQVAEKQNNNILGEHKFELGIELVVELVLESGVVYYEGTSNHHNRKDCFCRDSECSLGTASLFFVLCLRCFFCCLGNHLFT